MVFCGIAGEMTSTPRAVYNYARYRSKSLSSTIKLKNTNFVSLTTGRLTPRGCVHDGKNVQILSSGNRYEPTFTIHHQHKYIYIYKTIRRLVASDIHCSNGTSTLHDHDTKSIPIIIVQHYSNFIMTRERRCLS